jgi:hypothetical protein
MPDDTVAILVAAVTGGIIGLIYLARCRRRLRERLSTELSNLSEEPILPLQRASFRGAEREYGRVKCDGVAYATAQALVFHTILGKRVEIALADVTGFEENAWFLGAAHGGKTHLILHLRGGNRVGFFTADNDAWREALAPHIRPGVEAAEE